VEERRDALRAERTAERKPKRAHPLDDGGTFQLPRYDQPEAGLPEQRPGDDAPDTDGPSTL
jgi:hypothetical protein